MRCMQRLLRFRMGCHKLPRDTGCWPRMPRLNGFCTLWHQGVLGDENHLMYECPALQICVIGMRTCFKHLKVMPCCSSCTYVHASCTCTCGRMTSLVLLGLLTHAFSYMTGITNTHWQTWGRCSYKATPFWPQVITRVYTCVHLCLLKAMSCEQHQNSSPTSPDQKSWTIVLQPTMHTAQPAVQHAHGTSARCQQVAPHRGHMLLLATLQAEHDAAACL